MDCRQLEQILDTHAVSALSGAERARLTAHVAGCARCADALLGWRALADDPVTDPRAGLWPETLARVASQPMVTAPVRVRRLPRPALGLAAAVVIAVAAWFLLGQDRPADPAAQPILAQIGTAAETPAAGAFMAGRDYARLPAPAPTSVAAGVIEVCEFFSFDCIHCFNFEPQLAAWADALPAGVALVRVPVVYDEVRRTQARAFYTADVLGVLDRLRLAWFEEIHDRGNYLATRDDFRRFFVSRGVDPARFDETFDSFGVDASVRRAEQLTRAYGITSTPSMGVNGRYLVRTPAGGTHQDMLEIVDALVAAESPERERCDGDATGVC
jgi:thiol:disulfide interchange protein DsbA